MSAIRLALAWGLLLLAIKPVLAQSGNDSQLQWHPFHDVSLASLDDVWKESNPCIELRISETELHALKLVGDVETVTDDLGDTASQVNDPPRLLPPRLASPDKSVLESLAPADTIHAAGTGLLRWLLGTFGTIAVVSLGIGYWFYYVRHAIDTRHTTGHLRLSSALALPRRSGLFLVEVQDQSVIVATDGGGIRQVIPLRPSANRKKSGGGRASDLSQQTSSQDRPDEMTSSEVDAFQKAYHESLAQGGIVRTVIHTARSLLSPQIGGTHSRQVSRHTRID